MISIGLVIAIIATGLIITIFKAPKKKLDINLNTISDINYNNYLNYNFIDYKGNWFVWQKNFLIAGKSIAQNTDNEVFNVRASDSSLQIRGNQLFFTRNQKLKMQEIGSNKTENIASSVESFIVRPNDIVYLTVSKFDDDKGDWQNELYLYDIKSGKKQMIYEDIMQFYVYDEEVFVIDDYFVLTQVSSKGNKKICTIPVNSYPTTIMPQGDKLVYYDANNLSIFDVKSGEKQKVYVEESEYVNNRISMICDDKNIFVSFQATETNGSLVKNIDDEHNGLWSIDPKTLQKKKISDYVFDELYLFEDTKLFGTKGNKLFQIDAVSGQATPVTLIEK